MIFAPEQQVDGTRRFRYGGAAHTFTPARFQSPALSARSSPPAVIDVEDVRLSYGVYSSSDRAMEDVRAMDALTAVGQSAAPSASSMVAPSMFKRLRPNGPVRWMLPPVGAITPMYVEGILRGALAGNHVQAWELFDLMIDTDPEIAACIGEFIDGVVCKKPVVRAYAEEGEEPTDDAKAKASLVSAALRNMRPDMANDENDFRTTLKDILFARYFGQSVVEVDFWKADGSGVNIKTIGKLGEVILPRSTYWVHPVCYTWDVDGRLGLQAAMAAEIQRATRLNPRVAGNTVGKASKETVRSLSETPAWNSVTGQAVQSQVVDFPANKFLIGIDKFKSGTVMGSGSCLRTLAWWWIASIFGWDYMLNYAQLFGIPFRTATVAPGASPNKISEIKQMMAAIGSSGYAIMNTGEKLEFERAMGGAGESPQAFLAHFANDQKRKVILRQTMSGGTAGGGSKGVGKSFGDTEAEGPKEQAMQAGADFAESVVNLQLVPYILNVNYGDDSEAPSVKLLGEEVGNLNDAQRDVQLKGLIDIPAPYLHQKYGIPMAAAGEAIAGKDEGVQQPQPGGGSGGGGFGEDVGEGDYGGGAAQDEGGEPDGGVAAEAGALRAGGPGSGRKPWTDAAAGKATELRQAAEDAHKKAFEILYGDAAPKRADGTKKTLDEYSQQDHMAVAAAEKDAAMKYKAAADHYREHGVRNGASSMGQKRMDHNATAAVHLAWAKTKAAPVASSAAAPAAALRDAVEPLLARLKAIDAITDTDAKKAALAKFLKDQPSIAKAISHDPSVGDATAEAITQSKGKQL